jgi:hypothetical protein
MNKKHIINGQECWENATGGFTPVDRIKESDKRRDDFVIGIVTQAKLVHDVIGEFKMSSMRKMEEFITESGRDYKVKLGGTKGNVQLISFDGRYKVCRSFSDYIVFDERLQIAKKLIDDCIKQWSNGSSTEIQVLINGAFQVDKAGNISTDRVLGLRRLDIQDKKWKKAMEAISDALQVVSSKAYIRVYERDSTGKYQQIALDIASVRIDD